MTDIAIMSEMSLREQFEKETGYKLPDVRDYNSFELNVKLADYYERFSGWMKSKCEELQKENTKLKGKYNHLENHANERVHDLHQQLTAQAKELEAWQAKSNRQKGDIRKVHSELDTLKRRVGEESRQPEQAIAEADMMLHIAEGQLLGYYLSSCGTSITELVESMGLEQGEWENLSGRVNLKDVDRQEIEEYFLAVCEGGGE